MKRFFSQGSQRRSREDVEKEAAAELAEATRLGTIDPSVIPAGGGEDEHPQR